MKLSDLLIKLLLKINCCIDQKKNICIVYKNDAIQEQESYEKETNEESNEKIKL